MWNHHPHPPTLPRGQKAQAVGPESYNKKLQTQQLCRSRLKLGRVTCPPSDTVLLAITQHTCSCCQPHASTAASWRGVGADKREPDPITQCAELYSNHQYNYTLTKSTHALQNWAWQFQILDADTQRNALWLEEKAQKGHCHLL